MPIIGLTDNPRLPRLGKIHLGVKRESPKSGREYPAATDYFVCPPEVQAVYGETPRQLRVMFPTEYPDQWASVYYRAYSNYRGLICRGDGDQAERTVNLEAIKAAWTEQGYALEDLPRSADYFPLVDRDAAPEDIGRQTIHCLGQQCPDYLSSRCRQMMMLQCLLPEVPGIGIYQIDTSSFNSIRNIYGAVELIRGMLGRVAMVPLTLTLEEMQVTPQQTGATKTVHVLNLRCDSTLEALAAYRAHTSPSQLEVNPGPALPPPDDEIPEDFYPPEIVDAAPPEPPAKLLEPPGPAQRRTGKLGQCPEHGRPWGGGPDGRIGHPTPDGWCWKDEMEEPPTAVDGLPIEFIDREEQQPLLPRQPLARH